MKVQIPHYTWRNPDRGQIDTWETTGHCCINCGLKTVWEDSDSWDEAGPTYLCISCSHSWCMSYIRDIIAEENKENPRMPNYKPMQHAVARITDQLKTIDANCPVPAQLVCKK